MRRVCNDVENNIIWQSQNDILPSAKNSGKKGKKSVLSNGNFWINGGTVIECKWDPKEGDLELVFAEDDFRDLIGRVCCFKYPVDRYIDLKLGDRILLVYCANGAYFPMLLNERTSNFISQNPPDYFYTTNWQEVAMLPHPSALLLETKAAVMSETDKAEVREKYRKIGKLRVRDYIATFLMGFATFILLAFVFLLMVAEEIIVEVVPMLIGCAIVLVLSVVVMIVFASLLRLSRTAPLKKLNYKKLVLFHSICASMDYMVQEKTLYVYEKLDNRIQLVGYTVGFNNFVLNDVYYGQVLHKCSKEAVSCTKDINYFY